MIKKTLTLLILVAFAACDVDERTITDPSEMVERGVALTHRHAYQRAKALFEKAIALYEQQGNSSLQLDAYDHLITTEIEVGEFASALRHLETARPLAKKTGDFRADAGFSLREGDLYASMQNLSKAVTAYAGARQLGVTFNDQARVLEADLRCARALLWHGNVREANEYYQSLLQNDEKTASPADRAEILLGVGRVFRLNRQLIEAANSLTQALEYADPTELPVVRCRILHEFGLVQRSQGKSNEAITNFRDAVNVLRRARERRDYEVLMLFRIGETYTQLGRSGDAKKYFTDAMEIARLQGDRIAENYLLLWNVRSNYASMTPEQRIQTFPRLIQSYEQIARRFQDCGHRTGEGFSMYELGSALEQSGDHAGARAAFERSVQVEEFCHWDWMDAELHRPYLESFGVSETHQEWFDALANSLIAQDKASEALRVTELARLREYAVRLEQVEIQFRHPQLSERARTLRGELQRLALQAQEAALKAGNRLVTGSDADLSGLQARLTGALTAFRTSVDALLTQHVNFVSLFPVSDASLVDLQRFVPRGGVVVDYVLSQDRLAIFAITRTQTIVKFSPIGRDTLLTKIRAYEQLLNDPSVFAAEASAADVPAMTRFSILSTQIYDAVIRPLDGLQEKNLIIVANSTFGSFPFHALERQDRNAVHYVIEARSVDYIPSLTSLKYRTTTTARIRDVVAFGNPTGKQWSVDYELRDVRSFFKNARINIGLETSWNNVRSATGDVIQIATEFSEPKSTAPLGGIVLSNGLMVEEPETIAFEKLMEQSPSAVALLSNQSAQGSSLGPLHALVLRTNGTADVFLNCWTADRKSAKFFSEFFYTHLSDGLAPGDAYRQALISLIRTREVSHPHSWGQFFHFGIG